MGVNNLLIWNADTFTSDCENEIGNLIDKLNISILSISEVKKRVGKVYKGYRRFDSYFNEKILLSTWIRDDVDFSVISDEFINNDQCTAQVFRISTHNYSYKLVSAYCRNGSSTQGISELLFKFGQDKDTLITGDLNTKGNSLSNLITNEAGAYLDAWLKSADDSWILQNDGRLTWQRPSARPSALDATLCSSAIARRINSWDPLDLYISDHKPILLQMNGPTKKFNDIPILEKMSGTKSNWKSLPEKLHQIIDSTDPNSISFFKDISDKIWMEYRNLFGNRKGNPSSYKGYIWTDELKSLAKREAKQRN